MGATTFGRLLSACFVLLVVSVACGIAPPTPPTETLAPTTAPPTPTMTPRPTSAPQPTATPNITATKAAEEYLARIRSYVDRGYLSKAEGAPYDLDDYSMEFAQINYLSDAWPTGYYEDVKDFVFMADLKWESAIQNPEASGCGLYFRAQPNGDFYSVYLDFDRVVMGGHVASMGPYVTRFGVTSGSGRVAFGNPAEAKFTLIMEGYKAYVLVNDEFIGSYTLYSGKLLDPGSLAYFTKSGTNKDYGTRCQITNGSLWVPSQ